jgi:hypothetical protein
VRPHMRVCTPHAHAHARLRSPVTPLPPTSLRPSTRQTWAMCGTRFSPEAGTGAATLDEAKRANGRRARPCAWRRLAAQLVWLRGSEARAQARTCQLPLLCPAPPHSLPSHFTDPPPRSRPAGEAAFAAVAVRDYVQAPRAVDAMILDYEEVCSVFTSPCALHLYGCARVPVPVSVCFALAFQRSQNVWVRACASSSACGTARGVCGRVRAPKPCRRHTGDRVSHTGWHWRVCHAQGGHVCRMQ